MSKPIHRKARVGGRTPEEVKADPKATPWEIRELSEVDPLAALYHPNCPEYLWWELAATHPLEAPRSPAGQLFLLESPERWDQLERTHIIEWMQTHQDRLPFALQQQLAADCAEHVLPIYERQYPNDKRPREAIRCRRLLRVPADNIPPQPVNAAQLRAMQKRNAAMAIGWAWANASHEAHQAAQQSNTDSAWQAARASSDAGSYLACGEAARAAGFAAGAHTTAAYDHACHAERMWQWRRLQEYLRGAPVPSQVGAKRSGMGPSSYRGPRGAYRGKAAKPAPKTRYEQGRQWAEDYLGNGHVMREAQEELNWIEQESPHDEEFLRGARAYLETKSHAGVEAPESWDKIGAKRVQPQTTVGMRDIMDIINDPQASAEELEYLARIGPPSALNHPNCPVDMWWKLAKSFPLVAISSPLYELNILAEPEKWESLEQVNAVDWLGQYRVSLPSNNMRHFAADCAMRVLPVFEKQFPDNKFPRQAIETARAWGDRRLGKKQQRIHDAAVAVYDVREVTGESYYLSNDVRYAAIAAADTLLTPPSAVMSVAKAAQNAAYFAAMTQQALNNANGGAGRKAMRAEQVWQWRRLIEHLRDQKKQRGAP